MATDNRHRPGPEFRCPDCKGSALVALRPLPARGRLVPVVCRSCGREWWSKHKAARRMYATAKEAREADNGGKARAAWVARA